MAKQRVDTDSREAQRFGNLVKQLMQAGMSQSEIARRMAASVQGAASISPSYVNKLLSGERKGIGAGIVRMVKDGLGIDPHYFYDDYEGEADHKVYQLSEKRIEKKVTRLEASDVELKAQLAAQNAQIAAMQAQLEALAARLVAQDEAAKVKKFQR